MAITTREGSRAGWCRCGRCGGLMVSEFSLDLLNSTGQMDCLASRCVQCGDVVDTVILTNRVAARASLQPISHHNLRRTS